MSEDTFARDLIHELVDAGATYSHIARTLNVSVSAVCRWANGSRRPSGHTTFKLAQLHRYVLGKDVA